MEQCRSRRAVRGFTLMETLVTVLIIICLLAVSMVAVVTYRDYLKISELDNAAREICMAAQNRAVLLDGRGSLERLTVKGDGSNQLEDVEVSVGDGESVTMDFYYISSTDEAIKQLLPGETIDPALWNGQFYIVYEPESASVTDVFYAEKPFVDEKNFEQFYRKYKGTSKRERMKLSPMTGYYGGDSAQGGNTIALRTPVIRIYNEDELKAEVTWWVPRSLQSEQDKIKLEMTLTYGEQDILLDEAAFGSNYSVRVKEEQPENGVLYLTYKRTYLLDSLEANQQFKDIRGLESAELGDNFELTAEVSYTGDTQKVNGAKKTVENNSLFAYDEENSDDTVAYIEYLRHLQNLRVGHSNVEGKTQAVQIADIDASRSGAGYSFLPINNQELVSYKVRQKSLTESARFEIRDLHVETAEQYAGLFGDLSAQALGTASEFTVDGVRLVNAAVSTTASEGYAGALAGQASNAVFTDCQVYWEIDEQGRTNLQYLLGNNNLGYQYRVTGTYAGGLAGKLTHSGIVNSFASTLVWGTSSAGGLAGAAETLAVEYSYADCYVKGDNAAGLVGAVSGSNNKITDCFSAGFLDGTPKEGGFCLGNAPVDVAGSYSAMFYSQNTGADADYSNHYPLCEGDSSTYDGYTHYLFSSYVNQDNKEYGVQNQKLTGVEGGTDVIADLFGADSPFHFISVSGSHPYNLQTELSLSRYPYPAFADMEHYGDWAAEFSAGSLVYWEQYAPTGENTGSAEGEYGFEGANLNLLRDEEPVGDGYAVILKAAMVGQEQQSVTIAYTYKTADNEEKQIEVSYSLNAADTQQVYAKLLPVTNKEKNETYYLAPLPEEIVCSGYASADFYQKLSFEIKGTEGVTGTYYYSPHFAATMVEYDENADPAKLAEKLTVRVRTPRHLYELSCHKEYYTSRLGLVFQQELDLDYDKYTAYTDEKGFGLYRTAAGAEQGAIGKNAGSPFRCTYYGGCHVISNVIVNESGNNIGLFGYNMGTIRDTVYLSTTDQIQIMKKSVTGHRTIYVGGLVGYNNGTVDNCAVADLALQMDAYDYSTVYTGGLVGINFGTVTGSSAALKYIAADTTFSNAYLGGFVGKNATGGSIRDCYAVGRVAAVRSRHGNVVAAGFAGGNQSTIRNSYAATALTVSGEAVAYGFCADNTSSSNFYLNGGTYRYDGREYALQYEDGGTTIVKAQPQTYTPMTAGEDEEDSVAKRMGFASGAPKYGASGEDVRFPYPAVVRDAGDQVIHYGQWPEMLTLGTVGVCYWEKEVKQVGQSTNEAYHFSAIIVNPGTDGRETTVERISTLCTEHNDGGVITEYGYGYLYAGEEPTLSVVKTANATKENYNKDVSEALWKQTEGRYHFVVFRTRQEDDSDKNDTGLYLKGDTQCDEWTLKHEEVGEYKFYVNPFFGNALAYCNTGVSANNSSNVPAVRPGSVEGVPYEVRSVRQLSCINWNYKKNNTNTVLTHDLDESVNTKDGFPYLSYYPNQGNPRLVNDFWKQTHDLDGEMKEFSPIAEFYDKAKGKIIVNGQQQEGPAAVLWGWFGGSYDGSDYVIADIKIQGHLSSCVGLFGAVYNGTLKNIILYSSNNSASVTGSSGESASCWHAIGALAGLAASDKGSAVENCSVAGYTIVDQHKTTSGEWGGSGVGGLIGISNMDLSGCSAVTTINVNSTDNDNMRIGGLVGTCQKSISNCYSGGEINFSGKVTNPDNGAYIGGIVGGIYMRRIQVGTSSKLIGGSGSQKTNPKMPPLTNRLTNCYSYVVLPEPDANDDIRSLYAIGGVGDLHNMPNYIPEDAGRTDYINCYYLRDVVLSKNGGMIPEVWTKSDRWNASYLPEKAWRTDMLENAESQQYNYAPSTIENMTYEKQVHALSYEEMSDGTLLNHLHNGGGSVFSTVTVQAADGNKIDGKYSFSTSPELTGLNYPFPTVQTQANASYSSGKVNVHYGNWPLSGIERDNGSLPINIDLFADYRETEEEADASDETAVTGAAQQEENIWLSNLAQLAGTGTFKVSCANVVDEEGTGDGSTGTGSGTEGGGSTEAEQELSVAEAFLRGASGKLESQCKIESESEKVQLVVRGLRAGMAQVTVSYEPENSEISVPALTIIVNVTAELQLKPGEEKEKIIPDETTEDTSDGAENNGQPSGDGTQPAEGGSQTVATQISMLSETTVFTNERSDIDLYSFDLNGNVLPDSLKNQISLNVTGVSSVESAYLSEAVAANAFDENGIAQLPCQGLLSVASRNLAGNTSLIVEYEYTYKEKTYQSSSTVNVAVKELAASAKPVELYLSESGGEPVQYDFDGFAFQIAGVPVEGIEPEVEMIYNGNTSIASAKKDDNGSLQLMPGETAGTTTVTLILQFAYEGSSHKVTVYLDVSVYPSRISVTSEAVKDGVLYLYPGSNDNVSALVEAQLNERGQSADFTWELSTELADYVEIKNPTSYPAAAQEALSQNTEPQISDNSASEMNAQEIPAQGAEPQAANSSAVEIAVPEVSAQSAGLLVSSDSAAEMGAPEAPAQSAESQTSDNSVVVPEASAQSAELQIEEVQAVRHQSADGSPEEELIVEAEEVILPEGGAASVDMGAGTADAAADGFNTADAGISIADDAAPADKIAGNGIADNAASADNIIEETADGASEADSFDSFYSPQLAAQAGGQYSVGGATLSLTEKAKTLKQPVSGTLTVTANVKTADGTAARTSTMEIIISPNRNNAEQTAFLAVRDVNNVLQKQETAYQKAKEERRARLAAGETIEPYTELEVQKTKLRAINQTIPLNGVVTKNEEFEVESFWIAVLPRSAVRTVEDQIKENPDLNNLTEQERSKLQTLLLPEQEWKAALDNQPENNWEKDWSNYQVLEAGYSLEEPDPKAGQDTGKLYVKLTFTWSVYHEASARTVTYTTELFPKDLISVEPIGETVEAEQPESAGVDENGVAYYELELGGEAEGGDAGEAPEGGETGTEAAGQQPGSPDEGQDIVDGDPADGTFPDGETQPDVIIDSGTESMQPVTEFFEDIGADPVISETGEGFIVQEIELQTHSNEPEVFAEDAEITDF